MPDGSKNVFDVTAFGGEGQSRVFAA